MKSKLSRVTDVHPGKDRLVGAVLKTAHGDLRRAIQKVRVLLIYN